MAHTITLATSLSSVAFPIYNYGATTSYKYTRLPASFSQSGTFYPQYKSNRTVAIKKILIEGTVEQITETQKNAIIDFYKHIEGGKSLSATIVNDIETLHSAMPCIINEEIEFSESDIDRWNFNLTIQEI